MHWLESEGCCNAVVIENLVFCCCRALFHQGQSAIFTEARSPSISSLLPSVAVEHSQNVHIRKIQTLNTGVKGRK